MPIYEYQCQACGEKTEVFHKRITEVPATQCPHCNKDQLKKIISATAFHLKGSGWYVTDFRDKHKNKQAANSEVSDKPPEKSSESGKKSEDSKKTEKKSTDNTKKSE